MKTWYLYIIRCGDNSLYTGVATDVRRRFREHSEQGRLCAKYLRGKAPLQLVFKRRIGPRGYALSFEYKVKQLSKVDKELLISGNLKGFFVLRQGRRSVAAETK
jgi:putative endonuclease